MLGHVGVTYKRRTHIQLHTRDETEPGRDVGRVGRRGRVGLRVGTSVVSVSGRDYGSGARVCMVGS